MASEIARKGELRVEPSTSPDFQDNRAQKVYRQGDGLRSACAKQGLNGALGAEGSAPARRGTLTEGLYWILLLKSTFWL